MAHRKHEIDLITMHPETEAYSESVKIHHLRFSPPLGYLLNTSELRTLLRRLRPDLLHAHYASGYGTLARLSRFHPVLLSVWGSDVYNFPQQAPWKRKLVESNLRSADALASTSYAMKQQVETLVQPEHPITVTPFGVNVDQFRPSVKTERDAIQIGCIRLLKENYGIEYLLRAFKVLVDRLAQESMDNDQWKKSPKLLIVGEGALRQSLEQLSRDLEIADRVRFIGAVFHADVPKWLGEMDIFCMPSLHESFGVAAIEAAACGLPVVASNVGGLPEVVHDGVTGFLVPPRDHMAITDRLYRLVTNPVLRRDMGNAGRKLVEREYDWQTNAGRMEALYHSIRSGEPRYR